ncbi:LOW QUALITY PROTEIN: hypothetical protein CRUP_000696 [Coryphaenoides rupestris]|nr:LOW QUALITY PROTEIN: hypothetical protein CRUP_000696 [Coryphaenoides rupestris]
MRTRVQDVNPLAVGDSPGGALRARALQVTQELAQGVPKAFTRVVDVSSMDPQRAGFQPISYLRQLLRDENFALDVRQRARRLLHGCEGSSVGSYSPSSGLSYIQHGIAQFITGRDAGVPTDADNIIISSGSQRSDAEVAQQCAGGTPERGVGPPALPHTLAMVLDQAGVRPVTYRLREDTGWAVDLEELQSAVRTARGCCRPIALYLSNPGNPTGHVQNRKSIEEVIKFAAAERLFLLVDEVDQDSVHGPGVQFVSYKKVLFEMGPGYWDRVQMASFYSLSNGIMGECGLRAAYTELLNVDQEVMRSVETVQCMDISGPILGQLSLDVMLRPPRPSDPSYNAYTREILTNHRTLAENARRARDFLDSLPGLSCQPAVGGAYVYPSIDIPAGLLQRAQGFSPSLTCASDENFALDVRQRARRLLQSCEGSSIGSYSPPSCVHHSIAEFITSRDSGVPTDIHNIFICSGFQRSLMVMLKLLSSAPGELQNGVLVPLPSPHTLAMVLDQAGVRPVTYRLREDTGWAVDLEELQSAVRTARGCCRPIALYLSNPGNPTGHVQNRKSIEEVIKFAAAERLFLLVDEVDQDSVHGPGVQFVSYKKVLFEMGPGYWDRVQMASFYSLSNGITGECGLRAGYMELLNVDQEVMCSIATVLCTEGVSVPGQLALDMMLRPPRPSDPSYNAYTQEILTNHRTLAENARRARDFLDSLPGLSCQPAVGGAYVYPSVDIPAGLLQRAQAAGVQPDIVYCQQLLEEQGVCVGAGSENGHTGGEHHLRLCVGVSPMLLDEALERLAAFHLRLLDSHRC